MADGVMKRRSMTAPVPRLSRVTSNDNQRGCSGRYDGSQVASGAVSGGTCQRQASLEACHALTTELERVTGIEPALSAWEADVLPLNYTRAPLRSEPTIPGGPRGARPIPLARAPLRPRHPRRNR